MKYKSKINLLCCKSDVKEEHLALTRLAAGPVGVCAGLRTGAFPPPRRALRTNKAIKRKGVISFGMFSPPTLSTQAAGKLLLANPGRTYSLRTFSLELFFLDSS